MVQGEWSDEVRQGRRADGARLARVKDRGGDRSVQDRGGEESVQGRRGEAEQGRGGEGVYSVHERKSRRGECVRQER
jgi:hypothetical protein